MIDQDTTALLDRVASEGAARSRGWMTTMIERGADHYNRERMLPRLLPDMALNTPAAVIVAALDVALDREIGRIGHWSENTNLIIGLRQAILAERRTMGGRS